MNRLNLGLPKQTEKMPASRRSTPSLSRVNHLAFRVSQLSVGATNPSTAPSVLDASSTSSSSSLLTMKVSNIGFSQNSVSSSFSDGRTLEQLVEQLTSSEISPADVEPIRVVYHGGKWKALDNRRLRAFLDAFVDVVPVIKCDLREPLISKEFWSKNTSKSRGTLAEVRGLYSSSVSQQHFDKGIFVFNKRVLNWTFEQISQRMAGHLKSSLPDQYLSRHAYYSSFEELIFEEARAILQSGIEIASRESTHRFKLSLTRCKFAKKPENPTEIKFNLLPESERDVKAGDVLLIEDAHDPEVRLIALANYSELDLKNPQLSFKVVIDQDLRIKSPQSFEVNHRWNAKNIGSLITLQRMYEACTTFQERSETSLERMIWSGMIEDPFSVLAEPLSSEETELLMTLNPPQGKAVKTFIQLTNGLQLVQGPPGTGKTTTVVKLLRILQLRGERILVCAPSNKAVQILAESFKREYPDVPIILVGVEDKLPADGCLNDIFLDIWGNQILKDLNCFSQVIRKSQPTELIKGDPKFLKNRVVAACDKMQSVMRDFFELTDAISRYQLSFMSDLPQQRNTFQEIVEGYCHLISNQKPGTWKEVEGYVREPEEMPEFIQTARGFLSKLSMILSSMQMKLQLAQSDESRNGLEGQLIDHSRLVFSTLSITGQQRMKNMSPVQSLIVDEAGQAVEAETLIPLAIKPEKCLLIGDTQQLPATVISEDAKALKFGRSLMERLIVDLHQPYSMLHFQYRMHPEISQWPSKKYYRSELLDHESLQGNQRVMPNLADAPPFIAPYAFINIEGKESKGKYGRSFINLDEAKAVSLIVNYLKKKQIDVVNQVGIISFYKGQADYIRTNLEAQFPGIKVNTVDGFQGGENDYIIMSCVRANLDKLIGFVKERKRLNVALTRARYSLIILGHANTLKRNDIAELVVDAQERGRFFDDNVLNGLLPVTVKKSRSKDAPKAKVHGIQPKKAVHQKPLCKFFNGAPNSCNKGVACAFAHVKPKSVVSKRQIFDN